MAAKTTVLAIGAIIVVGGVAWLVFGYHKPSPTSGTGPSATVAQSANGEANVSLTATDDSTTTTDIKVSKGTKVNLTFNVSESGVYHGGLQFKSTDPSIDSGPIAPGASKTVTFVADKSFAFQPYWYASQVKKDYLVNVTVQ